MRMTCARMLTIFPSTLRPGPIHFSKPFAVRVMRAKGNVRSARCATSSRRMCRRSSSTPLSTRSPTIKISSVSSWVRSRFTPTASSRSIDGMSSRIGNSYRERAGGPFSPGLARLLEGEMEIALLASCALGSFSPRIDPVFGHFDPSYSHRHS